MCFENIVLKGVRYCIHCNAVCGDEVDDECPGCGENPDV